VVDVEVDEVDESSPRVVVREEDAGFCWVVSELVQVRVVAEKVREYLPCCQWGRKSDG
jgi:hypothetical protein